MSSYPPQQPVQPVQYQQTPVPPQPVTPVQPVPAAQATELSAQERLEQIQQVEERERPELKLYSHSSLFYWWPVWVLGYVIALVTYMQGELVQIGDGVPEWFHPSRNPGVIFAVVLFLVVLITNVAVRGLASAIVILSILVVTLLFAYLGWWDDILAWANLLSIHTNLGFYVFFSTLIFIVWLATVFVFDRMTYWRIKPGQITQEYVFGAAAKSYDTDNMVVEKFRDDLFRHWVLGLGSGDLRLQPYGANREEVWIHNVLFIGRKVRIIQHMIATEPEKFGHSILK